MRKERCTRQFALSAERNAKYHSSLMVADPFTIGWVGFGISAEVSLTRKHF